MKLCSRCRSDNNGDIKFCNFCGARMRTSVPCDSYEGSAPLYKTAQVVPMSTEVTDTKLAYRYFLKGKHAFAAGDLNRATLMFQCALDANPVDRTVKEFLQRVTEYKNRAGNCPPNLAAKRQRQYDLNAVKQSAKLTKERTESSVRPTLSLLPQPKTEPQIEKKIEVKPVLRVLPEAEALEGFSTTTELAISPSEYIDSAPGSEAWKDVFASVLVVFGLGLFGWVLLL